MKKCIVSANLSNIATIIYKRLNRVKRYGWFSQFVSEKLVESYYKDFEKVVLVEEMNKKTKARNEIEVEIQRIVKRLKKIGGK